ncbi:YjcQ family protein [Alkalihalophilus marmarensis]|uniref:YjcQ family protein n=1 Tax=Alkalihalophilus marmarensis TaxID=521377 RepID=UPI002E1C6886|nr:YjcQ family protein [Alkalihalophilus marmarensis]
MSKLDTKQKVLVAIYTEYQKDTPDMTNINAQLLEIEDQVFNIAVQKLFNEGLITDVHLIKVDQSVYPVAVRMEWAKMTPYGLEYIENKLGIDPTMSGLEKVKETTKKLGEWGLDQAKDIVSRIAAEMLNGRL